MAPHQKHYRAKMQRHGWMDDAGKLLWPEDLEGRQNMARALFGLELVSDIDYWLLLADDELDDTSDAPWAKPENKSSPERRAVFSTLNTEQREAVRELIRYVTDGNLHSLCVALDQRFGGATIRLEQPDDGHGEALEIHSPRQGELKYEQFQWLEDFSIIFGEDERHTAEG